MSRSNAIRAHRGSPEKLVQNIANLVFRYAGGKPQEDDQTLVAVRKT